MDIGIYAENVSAMLKGDLATAKTIAFKIRALHK